MMRSLSSAVAGLRTHQTKMDVIGNNIANVNTYGFKASRVTFSDVYYQTTSGGSAPSISSNGNRMGGNNPTQIGYGAQVATIDVLNSPSGAAATNRPLDIYLTGEGYITSRKDDEIFYTRLGNIKFDVDGNMVDHTGNIIQGFAVKVEGKETELIQVPNPDIDLNVEKIRVAFDELSAMTVAGANATLEEQAYIKGYYSDLTNGATISKVKDPAAKLALEDAAAELKILYDAMVAGGYAAADFNALKTALTTATTPFSTAIPAPVPDTIPMYVGDSRDPDNLLKWSMVMDNDAEHTESALIDITLGADVDVLAILTNVNVDKNGRITGILSKDFTSKVYTDASGNPFQFFANETYTIGQLAMANFGNTEGLSQAGNNYYKAAPNSGTATYAVPGKNGTGEVKAGYLEMSNVDISQEFTDMITTQRGFQANTRIITVSDEMLQELVNLKR